MIVSCGISIFENKRFQQTRDRYGIDILKRLFTEDEIEYAMSSIHWPERLGARFAAKCACFQAMGWECWRPYTQMSVVKDALGAPEIRMSDELWDHCRQTGASAVHLSISHIKECSLAQVITEKI